MTKIIRKHDRIHRERRFERKYPFLSIAGASALLGMGCAGEPAEHTPPAPADNVMFTDHVHLMPLGDAPRTTAAAPPAPVAPAGAHLTYFGGKVVQNARVTQVLYGPGTYIPELTSTSGVNMTGAYTQMLASGVFDWLSEYNTSSPAQAIGRGSFAGSVQISPAASRNGSTISDANIQSEIAAQIQTGTLPAPDNNQIYMVSFPSGRTLVDPSGAMSCVDFCAYHGTFKIGSQNVYYGVLPDLTTGCAVGCGAGTTFQNQQSVASHELIETVTDGEIGLATVIGAPLAWYDRNLGEIGDICNHQHATFTGTDGNTYTVQKEFSNQHNDCIVVQPTLPPPTRIVARTLGDLNGDGTNDILWRNTDGTVGIWLMARDGTVASRLTVPFVIGNDFQIQRTGDMNGDGTSDILWRNTDGAVGIWLMARDGTVVSRLNVPLVIGNDWQIQGTGDINGDGTSDILWRNTDGTIGIWLFARDGSVFSRLTVPLVIGNDWQIQGTGDINGDGTSDIVFRNTDGTVGIWLFAHDGTVSSRLNVPFVIGNDWQIQGIGDVNGDGTSDIVFRNTDGTIGIWLFAHDGSVASRLNVPFVIGNDWQIQGTGDVNGDGTSDIVFRDTDGTVGIWLFAHDATVASRLNVPFVIGNDWQIQN